MPHGGTIIDFPGQESNEPIFIFTRRFPLAFLPSFVLILLMIVLGIALIIIIGPALTYNGQLLLGSAFLLFMLLFTIIEFFNFYFDLYIVTDRRIVDINQKGLFNRTVSELLFQDVQDVKADVKGILATFFDFGDVIIQTAGAKPNFVFEQVQHPKEIAAMILDLSDQNEQNIPLAERHPQGPVAAIIDGKLMPHTADHQNELTTTPVA